MSERNLVNVWIYPYLPNEWHCQTFEGITGIGRTRDEAKAIFDRDWNQRAPYRLIEGHPPRQRRGDEPKPAAPAVEDITRKEREDRVTEVYHRALLLVHSDKGADGPLNRDEVTRLFTQLFDAAMGR